MRTVRVGDLPPEVEALLARRRDLGQDLYDEVWDGEIHLNPAPHERHGRLEAQLARLLHQHAEGRGLTISGPLNLGEEHNFRVPDLAVLADDELYVWRPTAALVVEIRSPGDESWDKFDHYDAHAVDEVAIVEPADRSVHWFARQADGYAAVTASAVLGIDVTELAEQIEWP